MSAANAYLAEQFVPDFNRRFTVTPADPASAFVPLGAIDLELLLSIQHERTVGNDSTVSLDGVVLQLPPTPPVSYETVVNLIGHTRTRSGLKVKAFLDTREYEVGTKISAGTTRDLQLTPHAFHPDWNYTLAPPTANARTRTKRTL